MSVSSTKMPQVWLKYERWNVLLNMNFIVHNEKNDKMMANYTYIWMCKKGRDKPEGLIWRQGEVWVRGKTCHLCQKVMYIASDY